MIEKDPTNSIQNLVEYMNEKENPLMVFGPGIYQYFKFLEMLVWTFGFLSILAIYQMYLFRDANPGFLGETKQTLGRQFAAYSLGSFNEIHPICWKMPYQMNKPI